MNDLVVRENNLPDNIQDLSKFILVGREKLVSVRAEIRAIDKLNLAQEVRNQKKEECLMLSEALLDAEVRLGDLLKRIPQKQGLRNDLTSSQRCEEVRNSCLNDTSVASQKPKHEVIKELGFNKDQANRFETLASNKDLVEQVKKEARENDDIPTRTRVLELAKARKQKEIEEQQKEDNYNKYLADCKKVSYKFHDTLYSIAGLDVDNGHLDQWKELLDKSQIEDYLNLITSSIPKLIKIQNFLKEMMK